MSKPYFSQYHKLVKIKKEWLKNKKISEVERLFLVFDYTDDYYVGIFIADKEYCKVEKECVENEIN